MVWRVHLYYKPERSKQNGSVCKTVYIVVHIVWYASGKNGLPSSAYLIFWVHISEYTCICIWWPMHKVSQHGPTVHILICMHTHRIASLSSVKYSKNSNELCISTHVSYKNTCQYVSKIYIKSLSTWMCVLREKIHNLTKHLLVCIFLNILYASACLCHILSWFDVLSPWRNVLNFLRIAGYS